MGAHLKAAVEAGAQLLFWATCNINDEVRHAIDKLKLPIPSVVPLLMVDVTLPALP